MTRPSANAAARSSTPLLAMTLVLLASLAGGCSYTVQGHPPSNALRADRLANGVALASGAAALPNVRAIAFTYTVRDGDTVKLSRTHAWDVKTGTDVVSVGDKSTTIDLNHFDANDPAQLDAFKAWANDAGWVMAPYRLFEKGVTREYLGRREVLGKSYEVLGVTRPAIGEGSPDRQNLYVDPYTSLIAFSDDAPAATTSTSDSPTPPTPVAIPMTWEQYRHPQNLVVSTFHRTGAQTIWIDNLSVSAD
jgi:hypothetical protein